MDLRKIKKLIELLEESDLAEMEIREGEESIRLSRPSAIAPQMTAAPMAMAAPAPAPVAAPVAPAEVADPAPAGDTITSPMVGTFYASPDPDSPEYVSVGSTVKVGDPLCIIEAMKTFNPIEAERSGTITSVLKKTGEPVEFGEPMFVIE